MLDGPVFDVMSNERIGCPAEVDRIKIANRKALEF
jgi:hypothetical protein